MKAKVKSKKAELKRHSYLLPFAFKLSAAKIPALHSG
jgi:hypothetical protein